MGDRTSIEWTDTTWNPTTGCTQITPGCDNCYAKRIVERFHGKGAFDTVTRSDDKLYAPFKWRRPRRVFVNSMSDLFHDQVPDSFIAHVFSVMARTPQHTYQLLTKRHGRLRSLLNRPSFRDNLAEHGQPWPLPNVWLGVSVEDQKRADMRIPALLDTPAAVRFLSCEPLLAPVDLDAYLRETIPVTDPYDDAPDGAVVNGMRRSADEWYREDRLNWVIVGGESGHGARPMHPAWVRALRDQCTDAGVPFFFKQYGSWVESARSTATHLLQVTGALVDRRDATTDHPYGYGSGLDQDLVDRGHPGWVRVRRASKKTAGRTLDGRTWDQYPNDPALISN